ncbi:MAG: hypothetical protein ABIG92_06840, partial [Candidatus Omnitrophota bacterium]
GRHKVDTWQDAMGHNMEAKVISDTITPYDEIHIYENGKHVNTILNRGQAHVSEEQALKNTLDILKSRGYSVRLEKIEEKDLKTGKVTIKYLVAQDVLGTELIKVDQRTGSVSIRREAGKAASTSEQPDRDKEGWDVFDNSGRLIEYSVKDEKTLERFKNNVRENNALSELDKKILLNAREADIIYKVQRAQGKEKIRQDWIGIFTDRDEPLVKIKRDRATLDLGEFADGKKMVRIFKVKDKLRLAEQIGQALTEKKALKVTVATPIGGTEEVIFDLIHESPLENTKEVKERWFGINYRGDEVLKFYDRPRSITADGRTFNVAGRVVVDIKGYKDPIYYYNDVLELLTWKGEKLNNNNLGDVVGAAMTRPYISLAEDKDTSKTFKTHPYLLKDIDSDFLTKVEEMIYRNGNKEDLFSHTVKWFDDLGEPFTKVDQKTGQVSVRREEGKIKPTFGQSEIEKKGWNVFSPSGGFIEYSLETENVLEAFKDSVGKSENISSERKEEIKKAKTAVRMYRVVEKDRFRENRTMIFLDDDIPLAEIYGKWEGRGDRNLEIVIYQDNIGEIGYLYRVTRDDLKQGKFGVPLFVIEKDRALRETKLSDGTVIKLEKINLHEYDKTKAGNNYKGDIKSETWLDLSTVSPYKVKTYGKTSAGKQSESFAYYLPEIDRLDQEKLQSIKPKASY